MNIPKSLLRVLLGTRLPITHGELQLSGPSKPITIHRDAYGIPYIQAHSEADAYFGLGFCQGQDRAFQLEMLLQITRGTLAEVIGAEGLPIDRLSRRLGFHRYAQGYLDLLAPPYRDLIEAFAQGIQQGVRVGCPKLPHEFALLRSEPTPWTAVDVLAGGNYIAFSLSTWSSKLSRLIILQKDGIPALQALDPEYGAWLPVTKPVAGISGPTLERLSVDLAKLSSLLGLGGASNNWALNASRTATGRPILANDPHLWPGLPAQWYLAHLQAPGLKVAGAAFVGSPLIPSGHNEFAAWGVTASLADNTDLYLERLGVDENTVQDGDGFISLQTIQETYQVKGQKPFQEQIRLTPRGPIISDVISSNWGGSKSLSISIQATWMTPQPVAGILKLHKTRDFDSFREAAGEARLVSQNIVYANTKGHIGWQYMSDVPQRKATWGILPQAGWDPASQWISPSTPWDQMPYLVNPESGYVSTANNKPLAGEGATYLGRDWFEYRQARILELLGEKEDWDIPTTQQMQVDQASFPWQEMRQVVLDTPIATKPAALAQSYLSAWDGVLSAESPAAAIYEFFILSMIQRMARSKAPHTAAYVLEQGFHPLVLKTYFGVRAVSNLVRNLKTQPAGWFTNGWPAEIEAALAESVHQLEKRLGPDPDTWRWGAVHLLVLEHPLGTRAPLDRIFNRGPFPIGGDNTTIAQANRLISEFGSKVTGLANLRAINDVGNWDACRFVIAGGQSGNPFSPHYDDLLAHWLHGETVNLVWSEDAILQKARQTLLLMPSGTKTA